MLFIPTLHAKAEYAVVLRMLSCWTMLGIQSSAEQCWVRLSKDEQAWAKAERGYLSKAERGWAKLRKAKQSWGKTEGGGDCPKAP